MTRRTYKAQLSALVYIMLSRNMKASPEEKMLPLRDIQKPDVLLHGCITERLFGFCDAKRVPRKRVMLHKLICAPNQRHPNCQSGSLTEWFLTVETNIVVRDRVIFHAHWQTRERHLRLGRRTQDHRPPRARREQHCQQHTPHGYGMHDMCTVNARGLFYGN